MIKHFLTKQFMGFIAVGGLAAFLHWLSRIMLSVWLPFSWAVALAYLIGMLVAFTLNSLFVFPKSEKPKHKQARDFVFINLALFPVVWLATMGINQSLQALGMLHYAEAIAHGIAITLPMFATFLIYKFFTFEDATHGRP